MNAKAFGHNALLTIHPAMTAVIKALDAKGAISPEALRLVSAIADTIMNMKPHQELAINLL